MKNRTIEAGSPMSKRLTSEKTGLASASKATNITRSLAGDSWCDACGSVSPAYCDFCIRREKPARTIGAGHRLEAGAAAPQGRIKRILSFIVGAVGALLFLGFATVWLSSGGQGIYAWGGGGWLWGCIGLAVFTRMTFPFTIGTLYCAAHVWGWDWSHALLWAAPGLALTFPGIFAAAMRMSVLWGRSLFRRA